MNQVRLIGRLTRDAELKERSETKVCDMRLAVNSANSNQPLFIDVVAFGETAEENAELKKGAKVEVSGALRYSEWKAKGPTAGEQPQRRSKHSVIAQQLATL